MDLRGMLNDNGPGAAAPSKGPQPPPPPPPPPPQSLPSTPVQGGSHQSFRDYNSQTQPSPIRHMSMDYAMAQVPAGAYASPPPPYQAAGPYPNRPAPPPVLQQMQIPPTDLRSPSIASGPGPSPYRQTPTSSISAASTGGYPFPPQHTPTSPVQRHQYPPTSAFHRDSYSQGGPAVGMTGPGGVSYLQGPPQTPPVGTLGGPHPYPHQRSQSSHSTPTPTSAQSQAAHYGAPYVQGSPVATTHSLPQMDPQQRQPSQPPTPVAAPLSGTRTMSFGNPPSPYQQRLSTTVAYPHPPSQRSPPPPHPPALPRQPSNHSVYDPVALGHDPHRRPQSHSDRERSISVSPKTRVPSLPSSAGRLNTSLSDATSRHPHILPASNMPSAVESGRERAITPAKRKLDDRELKMEELERREVRPPPFEDANGRSMRVDAGPASTHSSTPHHAAPSRVQKKRKIYPTPPVWAQKFHPSHHLNHPNLTLYRPSQHGAQPNGKTESLTSRHNSPEQRRAAPPQSAPPPASAPPVHAVAAPIPEPIAALPADGPLGGRWEPSITNTIPQEGMAKVLADFLFQNVVFNENANQIDGRLIKFEIEAKLGMLIDKSTNQRLALPVSSECAIEDTANWTGFRSSMSEAQHQSFNGFLNKMVVEAHPANEKRTKPRVPIDYKHRREIDKFYELPHRVRDQLPPCIQAPIASRGHSAKVRVTYDQKTNEILAMIVKARVADISLYFPDCPLDCRISINLEMDWDGTLEDLEGFAASSNRPPVPDRNKDRLSYTQGYYQVDLTQVTHAAPAPGNTTRQEKEHELEIELDAQAIREQGARAARQEPHQFVDLVDGFVNNIRVLARKAKEFAA